MFGDIGWAELLIIGVVALIVIGPQDLPEMFRQVGRFTAKIRSMAREFQRAIDQAAKDAGVNDAAKDLKSLTSPKSLGLTAVKEAADKFEKWDPLKPTAKKPAVETKPAVSKQAETKPAVSQETQSSTPAAPAPAEQETPFAKKISESGPATKALAEQQAKRRAVLRERTSPTRAETAGATAAAQKKAGTPRSTASKPSVKPDETVASPPPVKSRAKKAAKP